MGRVIFMWFAVLLGSLVIVDRVPAQRRQAKITQAVHYETVTVDGLSIFYRESGPKDAPTILLLHGFPSSSRMFEPLLRSLSDKYHLVAPDYPGFGHSDSPDPAKFSYTFDHVASVIDDFVKVKGMSRYSLYLQDYGGPVGFRLAVAHPERVEAIIIQNAVAHEDGLGPLWTTRRAFWADRAGHEAALRANFLSLEATRQRHIGTDPDVAKYDPDLWTDEYSFLSRPSQAQIQSDLFYDYRTNVASYATWQAWLQKRQPRLLVLWGRYDPSFQVAEADAYLRDVRSAEVDVLDAGHFALDTGADLIDAKIRAFLSRGNDRNN
jgi:pimeloyl-ACP methyl ester carboxylesterase